MQRVETISRIADSCIRRERTVSAEYNFLSWVAEMQQQENVVTRFYIKTGTYRVKANLLIPKKHI
jgi:hypothetical protein